MAQGDEVSSTSDLNSNFDIDELLEAYCNCSSEDPSRHVIGATKRQGLSAWEDIAHD